MPARMFLPHLQTTHWGGVLRSAAISDPPPNPPSLQALNNDAAPQHQRPPDTHGHTHDHRPQPVPQQRPTVQSRHFRHRPRCVFRARPPRPPGPHTRGSTCCRRGPHEEGVVRSKGFLWLATRHAQMGVWGPGWRFHRGSGRGSVSSYAEEVIIRPMTVPMP